MNEPKSQNKDESSIIVDGITVQYVGELIFDTEASRRIRGKFKETYLRTLEDFIFAIVFSDKFAVTGSTQKVSNEQPGNLSPKLSDYLDWK